MTDHLALNRRRRLFRCDEAAAFLLLLLFVQTYVVTGFPVLENGTGLVSFHTHRKSLGYDLAL